MTDVWSQIFDFSDYGALLSLLMNSVIAGAVLRWSAGSSASS